MVKKSYLTKCQSEHGSNSNEGVLLISQNSWSEDSPSDFFVSCPEHSAEVQSAYSTVPGT